MRVILLTLALCWTVGTHESSAAVMASNLSGYPLAVRARIALDSNAAEELRVTIVNEGPERIESARLRSQLRSSAPHSTKRSFSRRVALDLAPGASMTITLPLGGQVTTSADSISLTVISVTVGSLGDQPTISRRTCNPATESGLLLLPSVTCEAGFCAHERTECVSFCGDGCVYSFQCSMSSCSSWCDCKMTPTCSGR